MKVMLRENSAGTLLAYVAKKDLEEEVVSHTTEDNQRILTLTNGWQLSVSGLSDPIQLPKTVDAKRLA